MTQSALEAVSHWLAAETALNVPLAALAARQDLFDMTRQAQQAVLAPADSGAWSHAQRAAFAARIAGANNNPYLAAIYAKAAAGAAIVQPDYQPEDARERLVVGFMDKVANQTKAVSAEDVADLQQAGIADGDIVRLCELNAFLAYQLRVIAGLASLIEAEGELA